MSPSGRAVALEKNKDIEIEHEAVAAEGLLSCLVFLPSSL